jgi:hypothetical protein
MVGRGIALTTSMKIEAKLKEEQALKQKMERSVKVNLRND